MQQYRDDVGQQGKESLVKDAYGKRRVWTDTVQLDSDQIGAVTDGTLRACGLM